MAEYKEAQRSRLEEEALVDSWPLAELPFGRGTQNGKMRVTPVWLWLEWVRIESGGIVLHIEIMQPIEIA